MTKIESNTNVLEYYVLLGDAGWKPIYWVLAFIGNAHVFFVNASDGGSGGWLENIGEVHQNQGISMASNHGDSLTFTPDSFSSPFEHQSLLESLRNAGKP